jgi:hypothetical protein
MEEPPRVVPREERQAQGMWHRQQLTEETGACVTDIHEAHIGPILHFEQSPGVLQNHILGGGRSTSTPFQSKEEINAVMQREIGHVFSRTEVTIFGSS